MNQKPGAYGPPGWKTTEWWTTAVSQVMALLVMFGILAPGEQKTLEEAMTRGIGAVFVLIASGYVVVQYIKQRFALKINSMNIDYMREQQQQQPLPEREQSDDPFLPKGPSATSLILIGLLGTLAFGFMGSTASAEPILPWRQQINERLKFQEKLILEMMHKQNQPQPPLQILPILGDPKQLLPIGGEPKQKLPIEGDPKQKLPIEGDPKQKLPPEGEPKQKLPIDGAPKLDPRAPPELYTTPQWQPLYRALGNPIK